MQQDLNPTPGQPGGSKAEQEAMELLTSLLSVNPLPQERYVDPAGHEHEGVYAVGSEAAKKLNCVAIVRNGIISPIVYLDGAPEPRTPGERMHLFALTARTIMDGLMEALLFWEARRRQERGESDEGGGCHV
jgi:hypothetical protein